MQGLSKIFFLCHSFTKESCSLYVAFYYCLMFMCFTGFPGGSDGKEFTCNAEDSIWSLGGGGPLEKGMATHSSILAWRIPWKEEPSRLQAMELQRVRHNWVTKTFTFRNLSLNSLFFPNWNETDIQHYISFRCRTLWFDIFMYCRMTTIVSLVNNHYHT